MIAKISQRSDKKDHYNHCEDSSFFYEGDNIIKGGIFDGCSTGTNSHFASQLFCYAFANWPLLTIPITHDKVLQDVHSSLDCVADALGLQDINMLSTAIIFDFDKALKTLQLRIFGDAVYYINGVEYVVDQDNKPDYMGYYINKPPHEFKEYISKYPTKVYEDVESFVLCSDGILSFKRSNMEPEEPKFPNPIEHLLQPPKGKTALELRMTQLKRDKYMLDDDLSIISYVQDTQRTDNQL